MESNSRQTDVLSYSQDTGINGSEVLIEGDFIELDADFQYMGDVYILVSCDFVYVKEQSSLRESLLTHVLQHGSGKHVSKFPRSDVNIKLQEGCSYTFKAKWESDATDWKIYEMCRKEDQKLWSKWLGFFGMVEQTRSNSSPILPSLAMYEQFSDSSSENESSEDEDDSTPTPFRPLTLSVDRALSTWSMSMLNPSTVRKLALSPTKHTSLGTIGSENEDVLDTLDLESLYKSNSCPKLAQSTKSFRTPSLPNVSEMESICVDADIRRTPKTSAETTSARLSQTEVSRDSDNGSSNSKMANGFAAGIIEESPQNILLHQQIERLRAQPCNLNFVRRGQGTEASWEFLSSPYNRRFSLRVAMNNESNRIPLDGESPAGNQTVVSVSSPSQLPIYHRTASSSSSTTSEGSNAVSRKLDFKDDTAVGMSNADNIVHKAKVRRFWTILSKKKPKLRSSFESSWSPSKAALSFTEDTRDDASKYVTTEGVGVPKLTSYMAVNVRRGAVSGKINGKQEGVLLSSVMKQGKDVAISPPTSPVHGQQGRFLGF